VNKAKQSQNSSMTIVGTRSIFERPWRMNLIYSERCTQRGTQTLQESAVTSLREQHWLCVH
jgi:hypothetical protein